MICIAVNNALEAAKAEATAMAQMEQRPWTVTIGYDDYDRLCWMPVAACDLCQNDEVVFCTDPGSV
jgi:hypothetical protein